MEIQPQPLDDAVWDAIVVLTKLRLRIMRNGDGLDDQTRQRRGDMITLYTQTLATWLSE